MGQYWSVEKCAWVEWSSQRQESASEQETEPVTVGVPEPREAPAEASVPTLT